MKNNKFETQAEIFQALLEGKKIIHIDDSRYIKLIDGQMRNEDGDVQEIRIIPEEWSIYGEPKTKKQVWQWRYFSNNEWVVSLALRTEESAQQYFSIYCKYEKHAGPFEVDEVENEK